MKHSVTVGTNWPKVFDWIYLSRTFSQWPKVVNVNEVTA